MMAVRMAGRSVVCWVAWMDETTAVLKDALSVVLKAVRSAVCWAALMDAP